MSVGPMWPRVFRYVPPDAEGEVVFTYALLPKSSGVYEIRYHLKNTYRVLASRPIEFTNRSSDFTLDSGYDVNSPYPNRVGAAEH